MPDVVRLGARFELWSPADLDRVKSRPVVLLEPDESLVATLDHLGANWQPLGRSIPETALLVIPATPIEELITLVDRLLGPGGCPWDQAQTHESLKRHLLEEVYEVFDAIDRKDASALEEEIGDLLLQPIMHGQMAESFDTQEAARRVVDKLIRRHPHVFGDVEANDAETVLKNWDRIKQTEKEGAPKSLLEGVPKAMPALLRAYEISKRAARVGFEWPNIEAVWDKVREEEAELAEALASGDPDGSAMELGDLLFTMVNFARWLKIDPEDALRQMLDRFTLRFQAMERLTDRPLGELSSEEWDQLWGQAKQSV
jgi:tetrapyrrole methylase family protein/MazG family protein